MKTLLGMTAAAILALAACGGNVVVDEPGAGTGGATTTVTTSNITTITTITTTGTCSPTCSAAITTGGPAPCGGTGLAAYDALLGCACVSGGVCGASCGANFCLHTALSVPCEQCLTSSCGSNYQICTTN